MVQAASFARLSYLIVEWLELSATKDSVNRNALGRIPQTAAERMQDATTAGRELSARECKRIWGICKGEM